MKKEFYDIYEMLYADYVNENEHRLRRSFHYDEHSIIMTIRKSIDNADKDNSLRPDAKYFLIVNFHHLIVMPLFEQRPFIDRRREKEFSELEDSIQSDISTIISETKIEIRQEEISGHQIMKTIDRVWQKLKITRLEIWG